ncbi:MAG: AAA family ATPase, partial [bacterium]
MAEQVDEQIEAIISARYQGRSGKDYWQGQVVDWDIGLCRIMAGLGIDADRIDQLIRLAPAWPDIANKWDGHPDDQGRTYGKRTILLATAASRGKQAQPDQQAKPVTPSRPQPASAAELMQRDIPPIQWIIPGLLPQGLTVLAGKPKVGKSWLSLHWGLGVAYGGKVLSSVDVPQADVLYLALEDSDRRLRERIGKLTCGSAVPSNLYYCTEWPCLPLAAIELTDWLTDH